MKPPVFYSSLAAVRRSAFLPVVQVSCLHKYLHRTEYDGIILTKLSFHEFYVIDYFVPEWFQDKLGE